MTELENLLYGGEKEIGYTISVPTDFTAWINVEKAKEKIKTKKQELDNLSRGREGAIVANRTNSLTKSINALEEFINENKEQLEKTSLQFKFYKIDAFSGSQVRELHRNYKTLQEIVQPLISANPELAGQIYEQKITEGIETTFEWQRAIMYLSSVEKEGHEVSFSDDGQKIKLLEDLQDKQLLVLFRLLGDIFVQASDWEGKLESVGF